MDDEGLAGIEREYDEDLRGNPGRKLISIDARRRSHDDVERQPEPGANIVLTLDEKAKDFLVEKGYARQITTEEALAILDLTEKAGLVHEVGNSKEMGVAMCSCCKCCCTQLRATKELAKLDALAPSRFIAEVNEELCIVCGTCGERCQVDAVGPTGDSTDEPSRVNVIRCIGCGLCVTECPTDAILMKVRNNYHGRTPGPEYLPGWRLNLSGLASGRRVAVAVARGAESNVDICVS